MALQIFQQQGIGRLRIVITQNTVTAADDIGDRQIFIICQYRLGKGVAIESLHGEGSGNQGVAVFFRQRLFLRIHTQRHGDQACTGDILAVTGKEQKCGAAFMVIHPEVFRGTGLKCMQDPREQFRILTGHQHIVRIFAVQDHIVHFLGINAAPAVIAVNGRRGLRPDLSLIFCHQRIDGFLLNS